MTDQSADIHLPAGRYELTIPPAGANGDESGDLNFTTPVQSSTITHIIGAGQEATIIDGGGLDRVIKVHGIRILTISGVTIRNGYVDPASMDIGGGIRNDGRLDIYNSTITRNQAASGGGIANFGTLYLRASTIHDNEAISVSGGGGGIFIADGESNVFVEYSTISANKGDSGGGIFNWAGLFMVNSTLSLNRAALDGGGIYNRGTSNVYNTTIVFNHADADGDLVGEAGGVLNALNAVFNLRNTLLAGNTALSPPVFDDCIGVLTSFGWNLIGTSPDTVYCRVDVPIGNWHYLNSIATIGHLQDNGGPTWTHALLPGSNAIDGADPDFGCVDQNALLLPYDQRYMARVVDGDNDGIARCDVGAYEYRPPLYLPYVLR